MLSDMHYTLLMALSNTKTYVFCDVFISPRILSVHAILAIDRWRCKTVVIETVYLMDYLGLGAMESL